MLTKIRFTYLGNISCISARVLVHITFNLIFKENEVH